MGPFVGRTAELRAIAELLATPRGPCAALIVGEAGSGKSRLLVEARALRPRLPAFSVVGFEAEAQIPLAAAGSLLRGLAASSGGGQLLERVLFEAEPRRGRQVELEPTRVMEAARRALSAVQPAMLVVDDLHWIDDVSRSLCHYLVRSAVEADQQLVVLAAGRPGARPDELIDALPADQVHRIELGTLGRADGMALVLALDPAIGARSAAEVWERSGGNPFWLEALVRQEAGVMDLGRLAEARLRTASTDAVAVVELLATLGREATISELADLLGFTVARTRAALDELERRGVVAIGPAGARVAHDLLREGVVRGLPTSARRRLHARVAEHLERRADVVSLCAALTHRRAAGLRSLELARRIATAPERRLLGAENLGRLSSVAQQADPLSADVSGLHADLAALAYELGEPALALEHWSLAAELSAAPSVRARCLLEASRAAGALDRHADARELLALSRRASTEDPILRLGQLTQEAAIDLWVPPANAARGRRLAARAVIEARALVVRRTGAGNGRRLHQARLEAMRLGYEAALQGGDPKALLRAAEEHYEAARGSNLRDLLAAELEVAAALRLNGHVAEGVRRMRRVLAEANRAVLPRLAVDAGFWLGRTLALTGELREAAAITSETVALATRVGDVPRARHLVLRVALTVRLEMGDVRDALPELERLVAATGSDHQRISLLGDAAVWVARLLGPEGAERVASHLRSARESARAAGCPRCGRDVLLPMAEAFARIGAPASAAEALAEWDRQARRGDELDALERRHVAALIVPEPGERTAALEGAARAVEDSPYRLLSLWVRLDLGRALAATDGDRATVELGATAQRAAEIGAVTVRNQGEQALRALGVRTWRRSAAGSPLSAREAEIAALVAGGATNREVAATLSLSPKTVERHLANIFGKLEVRNRTELAAHLADAEDRDSAAQFA